MLEEYKIVGKMYENSRFVSFRAIKKTSGQRVILKLLKSSNRDESRASDLEHEYELLKSIDDPGIIKVYEIIRSRMDYVLVMEEFEGEHLQTLIGKNGMDIKLFLDLAIKITRVLGRLHKRNIIHKNINPGSILADFYTKDVKLASFEISEGPEIQGENRQLWLPDGLLYISPEQTLRMDEPVDSRSDLYSLGITFYHMLSGHPPFESKDPMEAIHFHIARKAKSLSQINVDIPHVLSDIIEKLMNKKPEDRYQTAEGLETDLVKCSTLLKTVNGKNIIKPFEIAKNDVSDKFAISKKLFGRDKELEMLKKAYESSCNGCLKVVMVTGPAGIGKTSLVNEFVRNVLEDKGVYAFGKYDQYKESQPYSAFFQAFGGIVKRILMQNENEILRWREAILNCLKSNAQIIIGGIPELEK